MQVTSGYGEDFGSRSSPRRADADPHGQAALFLSESILHALIEAKTFSLAQAIGVVQTALEVTADICDEDGGTGRRTQQSLNLLAAIEHSLTTGEIDFDLTDKVRES